MRDTFDMAREAGLEITVDPTETPLRTFVEGWDDQLKAFEAIVRADERAALVQEQALSEFYAQLEYNSPDWDVFACVYRRRADATPELVHREQLPRQTFATPVQPVGVVESTAAFAGGFHVRLTGPVMPKVGDKLYTAAAQPAVPEGWKLVPAVPTNEWVNNLAKMQTGNLEEVPFVEIHQCIAELLAAAPKKGQP